MRRGPSSPICTGDNVFIFTFEPTTLVVSFEAGPPRKSDSGVKRQMEVLVILNRSCLRIIFRERGKALSASETDSSTGARYCLDALYKQPIEVGPEHRRELIEKMGSQLVRNAEIDVRGLYDAHAQKPQSQK